jgi:hypothetical protein
MTYPLFNAIVAPWCRRSWKWKSRSRPPGPPCGTRARRTSDRRGGRPAPGTSTRRRALQAGRGGSSALADRLETPRQSPNLHPHRACHKAGDFRHIRAPDGESRRRNAERDWHRDDRVGLQRRTARISARLAGLLLSGPGSRTPSSVVGSGWEPTAWRAVQAARVRCGLRSGSAGYLVRGSHEPPGSAGTRNALWRRSQRKSNHPPLSARTC